MRLDAKGGASPAAGVDLFGQVWVGRHTDRGRLVWVNHTLGGAATKAISSWPCRGDRTGRIAVMRRR